MIHTAAVDKGVRFGRADAEARRPRVMDLWEDERPWGPYITNALRAAVVYEEGVDYIVRDGRVVIIDQATGRALDETRWTDNMHQVHACSGRLSNFY